MISASARSQAFLWAIGGHIVLLFVLFHIWTRKPAHEAKPAAPPVSVIEATLTAAPPSPQGVPTSTPPRITPSSPAANVSASASDEVREALPQLADQTETVHPAQQQPAPASGGIEADHQAMSLESAQVAPSQSGTGKAESTDDPYAEMRRQRAEAEHRYQVQQQSGHAHEASDYPPSSALTPDLAPTPPQAVAPENPLSPFLPPPGPFLFRFDGSGFPEAIGMPWWMCWASNSGSPINGPFVFNQVECGPSQPGN